MQRGRPMWALGALWLASRIPLAWITANDFAGVYRDRAPAAHDLVLYEFWAGRVSDGARPYVDFALEYPPANIPFLQLPQFFATLTGRSYEATFIAMALVLDALALVGLVLLCRGRRSLVGPLAWVVFVPLLGPVSLSRLDVVPACALVWAFVLARQDRWRATGVALAVAAGTKVFAALLLPLMAAYALRRRATGRFAFGFVTVMVAPLLIFSDVWFQLYDSVWRYHSGRGLAVESSWGSLILAGQRLSGQRASIELRSGAWEIVHDATATLKPVATLAVVAVALCAARIAWRERRDIDEERVAVLGAATVVLSIGLGNVFSAQYLIWAVAAVAVAAAVGAPVLRATVLIGVSAALTHLIFPIFFFDVLFDQEPWPITFLVLRNGAVLIAGALLLQVCLRRPESGATASDPPVEEDERLPPLGAHP